MWLFVWCRFWGFSKLFDQIQYVDVVVLVVVFMLWFICFDEVMVWYLNGMIGLNWVLFDIDVGEMVVVVGFFGLGKLIFIWMINGFVFVMSGMFDVGEYWVSGVLLCMFCCFCGDIGMVFQGFNFVGCVSVLQNVFVGCFVYMLFWCMLFGVYFEVDKQFVYQVFDCVVIFLKLYFCVFEFLGGQQQCVVIVCVFVQEFCIVFVDELVVSFDLFIVYGVMNDLCWINCDFGIIVVVNLYLFDFVCEYGVWMIGMCVGEIVYDGLVSSVMDVDFESIYGCLFIFDDWLDV